MRGENEKPRGRDGRNAEGEKKRTRGKNGSQGSNSYPKPLDLPLVWSTIICASVTAPNCLKYSRNSPAFCFLLLEKKREREVRAFFPPIERRRPRRKKNGGKKRKLAYQCPSPRPNLRQTPSSPCSAPPAISTRRPLPIPPSLGARWAPTLWRRPSLRRPRAARWPRRRRPPLRVKK